MTTTDLTNKVVLITGATGGIGEALAYALATEHAKLALTARREDNLKTTTNIIKTTGADCIYIPGDASKKQDVQHIVTTTNNHYGHIDIAILTAGILEPNPIETFNSDIILKTMDINFKGNLYYIDTLLPIMKKQKNGTIAAVSTLPDKRGVPGWGAYGASKAALSWLLESLRGEAKIKYNINIVTIKPGSVQTPMITDFPRYNAIPATRAAKIIIHGLKHHKKVIEFPFTQVVTVKLVNQFPPTALDHLPMDKTKGEGYPDAKDPE
jgi:NADP-dependent 3-hydroxy acid dehydrogenase YdfG